MIAAIFITLGSIAVGIGLFLAIVYWAERKLDSDEHVDFLENVPPIDEPKLKKK